MTESLDITKVYGEATRDRELQAQVEAKEAGNRSHARARVCVTSS